MNQMKLESYFETEPKNFYLKRIGHLLRTNKLAKITEILLVFIVSLVLINLFISDKESHLIYNQLVMWSVNISMLLMVFIGIKLRGEGLNHFGFIINKFNWKKGLKMFLQSILVAVLAMVAFIIGSVIIGYFIGIPESSDFSSYNYLKENVWLLFLTLAGVYVASSFGEEVIYRAFLINRLSELGLNIKFGKALVVITSSIVFGLIHYNWGLLGVIQTSFMGLVLCISYLYLKKKIWTLVLAHAIMDTVLFLQIYFG